MPQLIPLRFQARTVPALLAHTARRVPERVFVRFLDPAVPDRPPREVTFGEFRDRVRRAAAFLERAGLAAGERVLLLGESSPEWQELAIATQLLRAEPAAVFASLAADAVEDIARRVRPRVIFVSTQEQWQKLAAAGADLARGGLVSVLSLEALPSATVPDGVAAADLGAALAEGAPALDLVEFEARAAAVGEEAPFLLLFTSGTTGRQKGVRLPQRTIVHALDAGAASTGTDEHDVGLHLLPFGHVAGHDQFALALGQGHGLVMVSRREDVARALALGPTYLFAVPLVYERVRAQVLGRIGGMPGPLRATLRRALDAAARVRVDGSRAPLDLALALLAGALLGARIRKQLGGRVRGLYSGGAPASEALFRFFEGLGIPFVELYGMSETAGMIASNLLEGPRQAGVAGLVTPDHELRFAPDGELQLRGPLLFTGYLEASDGAEAFTDDGFFRTGDLGQLDARGWLRITGRKKHVLVLSTGKKVAPEPLESALAAAEPFRGAVLIGEGRPYAVAAVFVEKGELARLSAAGQDPAAALLPVARAAVERFSEFEKPKRLLVLAGTPEDHPAFVTPTLKLRRERVLAELAPRIAELYARP